MKAIYNFLEFINENWTTIAACLALAFAIYMKIKKMIFDWMAFSEEEKQAEIDKQIEKAKEALKEVILSYVSSAEITWNEGGMGIIKRSEVIDKVYAQYPVLLQVIDQEELVKYIDKLIDEALVTVREKIRTA